MEREQEKEIKRERERARERRKWEREQDKERKTEGDIIFWIGKYNFTKIKKLLMRFSIKFIIKWRKKLTV